MLLTRSIPDVEILSEGTWPGSGCPAGGCAITSDDLDAMIADFESRKQSFQAPVKLGHDDNQVLLQQDGYPAAGWLANLRRKGTALVADLVKVPAKIADLIDAGAYANRSIELEGNRVVGLALLGADLPAVENLGDVASWYRRVQLSLPDEGRVVLTHQAREAAFALPAGMSYDDLSNAVREAFIAANPGASGSDTWVSDLYDGSVIVCMDGRYWQQAYTVGRNGAVTVTGMPVEVSRVTEWRDVAASRGQTYADNAARVLADVQAFNTRTAELAALRAKDGRSISEKHRERLASLRDGLRDAHAELARFVEDEAPPAEPDYSQVMQARTRLAQLRMPQIAGVNT